MERRLATVLATDVVGYSALMQRSEADTISRLKRLRNIVSELAERHGARVISWAGDGALAEFASPVSAVRGAFELQRELSAPHNSQEIGLQLRIGIHLADVVVDGKDLLGDGVNIAARIEAEAEPGGVLVSHAVFEQAKRGAQVRFKPIGHRRFKNIDEAIELYSVEGDLGLHSCMLTKGLPQTQATKPQQRDNGVIVLPFQNRSTDPEQQYFAEGFTEDVITELSRFTELFVISRNASFSLEERDCSPDTICGETGVRYAVEGGVRVLGERVRVSARLFDGSSGAQVWSENYDCEVDELFDVQDDMVAKISAAVAGRVEQQAEKTAREKPTSDMAAYDCLKRGLHHHRIGGVTRENAETAMKWLKKALEKDPTFGRAQAWLACAVATRDEWLGIKDDDLYWEMGRRALELDSNDAEVHRIMGSLSLYKEDFDNALYHYSRALEITPNHAYIVAHAGNVHNYLGDGEKGLVFQRRAEALDPYLPEYCREVGVIAHYTLRDWEACFQAATAFPRLTRRAAAYRAAAALHLDDTERLKRAIRRLATIDPEFDLEGFLSIERFQDSQRNEQLREEMSQVLGFMNEGLLHAVV
ncbi:MULTISPECIES: adenylate/guanylate cyclase domain-containing protein [unclassified Ruegeria]|uniref:adenylate/guanylate cyclase domain-containing protein n=1 Tax=unclassified Ruegeria TaxID=2625375 RepID=UPI0014897862|nr:MULTISPECIES: adenylate/guanylate cyclase domain-containing protein [unclassified Ruegeria]